MARKYLVGGRIYLETGTRKVLVGGRALLETTAAGGGPTYTLTVTKGTVTFAGQSVELKAGRNLGVTNATVSFSGQTTGLNAGRNLSVTNASMAFGGQSTSLNAGRHIGVTNATVAMGGQNVTLTYSGGVGPTYTLTVTQGTVAFSGQSTSVLANRVLTSANATLTFAGQSVDLTYGAADTLEIYKTGDHVWLETSAGPTYDLDILVATNSGDSVTVTDSVTGVKVIADRNYGDFRQNGGAAHGATAALTVTALNTEFST
jgi:hypothetical protein